MVELPADLWARVLYFSGETSATATAHGTHSAGRICLEMLLARHEGCAEYIRPAPAARLGEAFAAAKVFKDDGVLARYFAYKRPLMHAYFGAASCPSLSDFIAWLFMRPDLSPLRRATHRKTSPDTLGLSFGIVRERGIFPRWVVSEATTSSIATDLLRALQGLARAHRPGFPYIWARISASPTPRNKYTYAKNAIAITLSNEQCYELPGGMIVPPALLEPGIIVSFNSPTDHRELTEECANSLQSAGFEIR